MENTLTRNDLGAVRKIMLVILAAFLMGTMWRIRGESGWGSSWGLLTVGLMVTMLIYCVFGYRKKASVGYIAATAIAFMLTPPAWGTLLNQITGVIVEQEADGTQLDYYVSPWSGVFFMLCLGFGMACLFAVMISAFFSQREYKWYHFLMVAGVYLLAEYAAKASVSHLIVGAIQPESCRFFSSALAENGETGGLWRVYLSHFSDMSWAKKITGGRNYFAEIEVVSRAIAALAAWVTVRIGLKDKTGGRVMISILGIFAFSITLADLWFFFGSGGYHMAQFNTNSSIISQYTWSLWEYFTGFISGGLMMTAFLLIPEKSLSKSNNSSNESFPKITGKIRDVIAFVLVYGLGFATVLIRPIGERLSDIPTLQIIAYAALGATAVIIGLLMLFGKIPAMWKAEPQLFSMRTLPMYILASVWIYFFIGVWDIGLPENKYTVANFLADRGIIWWMMILSTFVIIILHYAVFGKYLKKNK